MTVAVQPQIDQPLQNSVALRSQFLLGAHERDCSLMETQNISTSAAGETGKGAVRTKAARKQHTGASRTFRWELRKPMSLNSHHQLQELARMTAGDRECHSEELTVGVGHIQHQGKW